MLSIKDRWQGELFVAGSLRDLVPDDHVLKKVHRVLDLSWIREEVKDEYCLDNGRPGIDPEAAVRLMLAGLLQGIVHDRKLLREAQVNLAIRWFVGYRLDEKLPHHSSLTRIRRRWGVARFLRIFQRTIAQCVEAGLVKGDIVHIDATLIRADVSWESLVRRHVEEVVAGNDSGADGEDRPDGDPSPKGPGRPRTKNAKPKKVSTTDPDATLTTGSKEFRMQPSYKQQTAVDDASGVVLDAEVTTGEASEGKQLMEQIERVEANTGVEVETVTADAGYAHAANYIDLELADVEGIIPPQREPRTRNGVPIRRFKFDPVGDVVRCPRGKVLRPKGVAGNGRVFKARPRDCRHCGLRDRCVPRSARARTVLIVEGYTALLRARRHRPRWDERERALYTRHRWRVEGTHGTAKTQHGLGRAVRRRLWNVQIQAYLTAAAMNLKRLAASCARFWARICVLWPPWGRTIALCRPIARISLHPAPQAARRQRAA